MTLASSPSIGVSARCSCMTPDSASVISIKAVSIVSTWSDSSTQSAKASLATGSDVACKASSAVPRKRVRGVRRSCATLSSAWRMPWINDWFLSRTRLNCCASCSKSVRSAVPATRAEKSPVSRIARAVATTSRTGWVARCEKSAPPSTPSNSAGVITARKLRRNGCSTASRLLVLRPTSKTELSGRRNDAMVSSRSASCGTRSQIRCDRSPPGRNAAGSNCTQSSGTSISTTVPEREVMRTKKGLGLSASRVRWTKSCRATSPPSSYTAAHALRRVWMTSRS